MYASARDVPLAKNPSTGTAQQRLFLVLKVVLHAVVVISEVLRLSTKNRCSRCCKHISSLAQCSAAWRHLQCKLYAILGGGIWPYNLDICFYTMLHCFYGTISFAFSCKAFWHFLNNQLVQANWLLGLHCTSCFGIEDCLLKAVHRAQPFGMRATTL